MDWLDLLAVQGTLRSLQHHSSKASGLQHTAVFMVQLSHLYMTAGKTTALTRQTFVGKVTSLLFNMLYRLIIAFLPRSWQQSPSAVVFSSVQSLRHVRLFATPWTAVCQASLSIPNYQSPPKRISTESMMPSNHLISSSVVPFFSFPQSLPESGFFQLTSSSHQVIKVLEFQLQHQSYQWTPRTDLL